jgi:hypothetical protein
MPVTLTGVRDGHRIITTVTRMDGIARITREHHPECPNHAHPEETPMPDQPSAATWPTFTLQRWNWTTRQWDDHAAYGPDARSEGNAYDAVSGERASQTGPIRLLKDGVVVLADDPATFYSDPT